MLKKVLTLANLLTVVSIGMGIIAYKYGDLYGHASLVTGIAAFGVGIA